MLNAVCKMDAIFNVFILAPRWWLSAEQPRPSPPTPHLWCPAKYTRLFLCFMVTSHIRVNTGSLTFNLINSLGTGWCINHFIYIIFKLIIQNCSLGICCEIELRWMSQSLINESALATLSKVNIGSGNGLVPGTKPLPEPMLIQIYVAIWYHQTIIS